MVYAWYDRANMMKTTLELINHSHSLCEIMYVCEGGMSIETEAGRVELGRRQLVWLDAGVRHWNMGFSDELCSMMNLEFQYEASDGRAPSLRAVAEQDEATRHMLERGARVADPERYGQHRFPPDEGGRSAGGRHRPGSRKSSARLLCVQMMLEVARLLEQNQSQPCRHQPLCDRGAGHHAPGLRRAADQPPCVTARISCISSPPICTGCSGSIPPRP